MNNSTRIISNTGILYVKMGITVFVSLYSVRLVLASLGAVDYGIFNVLMGVITMLSFLNAAMSVSSQRFLSFYQGKKDMTKLRTVYNLSVIMHLLFGLVLCLLLSLLAKIIVFDFLQIPEERLYVSLIIFHCMAVSVFFTVLSVPYTALINSNEKMIYIAIVTIIESVLKLVVAIILQYITCDKLLFYGVSMGFISVISLLEYFLICKLSFKEARFMDFRKLDWKLGRQMVSFIGWNLIGSITAISKNQGLAILFNVQRGPIVNAAYAIANQVSGQLNFFSATLLRAINPQIMKKEGAGDRQGMIEMSLLTCKYSFLLLLLFSVPCIFQMETILSLWLKNVPQYSVYFCVLILVAILFDQLTVGINSAFQAANIVKQSAINVGIVKLLIIPLGFVFLYLDYSVYMVVIGYALVELFAGAVRLALAKKYFRLSFKKYFQVVLKQITVPVICCVCVCMLCNAFLGKYVQLVMCLLLSTIVFVITVYRFSFNEKERGMIRGMIGKLKNRK